jgi:hypothetical protein
MRAAGHIACKGKKRNVNTIVVGSTEGKEEKRALPRPRLWWEDKVKLNLKRDRIGWCGLD